MNSDIINKGTYSIAVKRGDTFDTISEKFKLDKDFLVHLNNQAYTDNPVSWRKDMFGKILLPFKMPPSTPKAQPTPNITSGKKEPVIKKTKPISSIKKKPKTKPLAKEPPSTLPTKPTPESMTVSSSPTNAPILTTTNASTVSPTAGPSTVPTATPTTGTQMPSLTQTTSPQPSPPTTLVMSPEEQKVFEKELDLMIWKNKMKEKETLLDTITKTRVKIEKFKKENKNYTELENKLKEYREQLDEINKDVDELRAKSISSGGAGNLFADVDDSEFQQIPDNRVDMFNQIKNYENKKQKEIQDRETEINKQRKKLNDIDFSLDISITRQLFGIMNYLLNPFDFQKQIYMWDIYQSDIFDSQLDIGNINVQNIQINLREYKRIFGDPIVPQQISSPNDEQQALLKQITKIYKLEYEKINYKMNILTKTFNSS